MVNSIQAWRSRWQAASIDVIPITPNSKKSKVRGWQLRDPQSQWQDADPNSNLAVRVGGNHVCGIDCDSPTTTENIKKRLADMGLVLPEVETISGGRHLYTKISGIPENITWKRLCDDLGPGEFRARKAYMLAPCSTIDGNEYKFVLGNPEAIARLPLLHWSDFTWLISPAAPSKPQKGIAGISQLPIPLIRRGMPERAEYLFDLLATASKGQQVDKYTSRSEAEAAIVTILLLVGWTFEEILQEFFTRQPGHFKEQRNMVRYATRTYQNVTAHLMQSPVRKQIKNCYLKAQLCAWPGRGGGLALATYQGFLAICWQFQTWEINASVRNLAQFAAASPQGVVNAIEYLKARNLIKLVSCGNLDEASRYQVIQIELEITGHKSQGELGYVGGLGCEMWSYANLGRSAGMIYPLLSKTPINEHELSERTGKCAKTICKNLGKLQKDGLAKKVKSGRGPTNRLWVIGDTDINDLLQAPDLLKAETLRRNRFELQSKAWRARFKKSHKGRCAP